MNVTNTIAYSRDGHPQFYSDVKVVVSGHVVEVYQFEKPVKYGGKSDKKQQVETEYTNRLDKQAQQRDKNIRAKNNIRRLAISNFSVERSKFLTLTFRENITDVKQANKLFDSFMKRLRYRAGKDFKYIAVIEFQKRGAIHFHLLLDIPFMPVNRHKVHELKTKGNLPMDYEDKVNLAEIWQHGFIFITDIAHVDNIGAYLSKYMIKDSKDQRLAGLKAYQTSKNLKRPIELRGNRALKFLVGIPNLQEKSVFNSCYLSEYAGLVKYTEYNLSRDSISKNH